MILCIVTSAIWFHIFGLCVSIAIISYHQNFIQHCSWGVTFNGPLCSKPSLFLLLLRLLFSTTLPCFSFYPFHHSTQCTIQPNILLAGLTLLCIQSARSVLWNNGLLLFLDTNMKRNDRVPKKKLRMLFIKM